MTKGEGLYLLVSFMFLVPVWRGLRILRQIARDVRLIREQGEKHGQQ